MAAQKTTGCGEVSEKGFGGNGRTARGRETGGERDGGNAAEWPDCRCLWNQSLTGQIMEQKLEAGADILLRSVEADAQYPAYTELQMARHGEGKRIVLDDAFLEDFTAAQGGKDLLEEIYFIAPFASLTFAERIVLMAAVAGDTQEQSGRRFVPALAQQQVSRLLRSALNKCYDAWDWSFEKFCRHTVYRRPARRRHTERGGICLRCRDWFPYACGAGRYCSERCRSGR